MPSRGKTIRTRVRLRRSDVWRTVLTDTAPFEVPIIFSNDGFYKNLCEYESKSDTLKKLMDAMILSGQRTTAPWRYNIVRDAEGIRTLSLLHPRGQADLARFYDNYHQLICEYGQKSPFSIRKPTEIGSSFYFASDFSEENKYKGMSVDINQIDRLLRNPASYFSYEGYDRLFRFFESAEHISLESRFKFQLFLDVNRCFDSIYTHSISWAVKEKKIAKEHRRAHTFGNLFDRTMQRLNDDETSGICIGPETSRIFAEIILAKADEKALTQLRDRDKLVHGKDFECRRYVDNYYIFSNSETILTTVQHAVADALMEYKLYLNEGKTERHERPFYSPKSLAIDTVKISIQKLWERTLDGADQAKLEFPRRIIKHRSLFSWFTREVKAACFSAGVGYGTVANYVISAVKRKLVKLADTYDSAIQVDLARCNLLYYRQLMVILLDIGFYFFTLHPTVASSLRLSHAIIRVGQHLEKHDEEGLDIAKELVFRWTVQLMQAPAIFDLRGRSSVMPVEILNVLVSVQQLGVDGELAKQLLETTQIDDGQGWYFQVIVIIYVCGRHAALREKKEKTFRRAFDRLVSAPELSRDSELVHLLLDLLACSFVEASEREKLLKAVWPALKRDHNGLGNIGGRMAVEVVSEIERQHWFVRWEGVDLLNMIEKKELSAVYS